MQKNYQWKFQQKYLDKFIEYYQFKNLNPCQIGKLLNKQNKINLYNPNVNPNNDITQKTKQIKRKINKNYYTIQQMPINNDNNNNINLKQMNKFVENNSYYIPKQNQFINIDNNNIINYPKPINKIIDNNSYYTSNQNQIKNNTNNKKTKTVNLYIIKVIILIKILKIQLVLILILLEIIF